MNKRQTRDLILSSYKDNTVAEKIGKRHGYQLDQELSNKKHKIYVNNKNEPTIVYRGTTSKGDVLTDLALGVGLHKKNKKI